MNRADTLRPARRRRYRVEAQPTAIQAQHREVTLIADLPRLFSRLTKLLFLSTLLVEASLIYRIYSEWSGQAPRSFPGSWAHGLAGWLVRPFAGFDNVQHVESRSFLDFPALVAVEVFLAAGLLLIGFTWSLEHLLDHFDFGRWSFTFEPDRVRERVSGAVRDFAARIAVWERRARAAVTSLIAYIRARDWQGYRATARDRRDRAIAAGRVTANSARLTLDRGIALSREAWLAVDAETRSLAVDSSRKLGFAAETVEQEAEDAIDLVAARWSSIDWEGMRVQADDRLFRAKLSVSHHAHEFRDDRWPRARALAARLARQLVAAVEAGRLRAARLAVVAYSEARARVQLASTVARARLQPALSAARAGIAERAAHFVKSADPAPADQDEALSRREFLRRVWPPV